MEQLLSVLRESVVQLCRQAGYGEKEMAKIQAAIDLIKPLLQDKKRLAGDTFFDHNLRVGAILLESGSSVEIVLAGLLHGTLPVLQEDIKAQCGADVLRLVQEVDDVKELKSKQVQLEAEVIRKMILSALKDVRVIFIKLANKLDNLRSSEFLPPVEQQRVAQEVLDIYAPLAYRLGAEQIRVELENLAFQLLHPAEYKAIADFLAQSKEQREADVEEAIRRVQEVADGKISLLKIKGRPKHIYSIYRKITQRHVPMEEQYDLLGLRVVVPDVKECYTLLGLLHQTFEPVEGKLKDYIANPKPNYYRSLHTALRLPNGKIAEVQIRTPQMDEFAEEGLAAHWQYKGLKADQLFEKRIGWLKSILELQEHGESREFLESAKVDVFGDKVYCYTPKGTLKELPQSSCVLDFAYAVHEEIGNQAVGGRVNGQFVPLKKELQRGDVVEIVTNKNQRPRRSWLKLVRSVKARQKIRKSLKHYEKLPALYIRPLAEVVKEQLGVLVGSEEFSKAACLLAKCCTPLPGDPIVGIFTKKRLISVHQEGCRMAQKEENRWVPVSWRETFNQKIKFFVRAEERSGLLADLLHTIASSGFEVKEAKAKLIDLQHAECSFLVIPQDLERLQELVRRIKKVKSLQKIWFE